MKRFNARDNVFINYSTAHHFKTMGIDCIYILGKPENALMNDIHLCISGIPSFKKRSVASDIRIYIKDFASNATAEDITELCLEYIHNQVSSPEAIQRFQDQYQKAAIRWLSYMASTKHFKEKFLRRNERIINEIIQKIPSGELFNRFGEYNPRKYSVFHPFNFYYNGINLSPIYLSDIRVIDKISLYAHPGIIISSSLSQYSDAYDSPLNLKGAINIRIISIYDRPLSKEFFTLKSHINQKLKTIVEKTSSVGPIYESISKMRNDIDNLANNTEAAANELKQQMVKLDKLKDLVLRVEQIANNL